ncbi:hypothetical protein FRC05_002315 [Tulasnella sp. 425]|nr:hypothetical protein FRC05_002315 [Tulasnella sp. 425]
MSSLWQIPELVHMILELLSGKDQVRVAQVCRVFWVNVLPLRWRHVHHFKHVVRLLPEDSVTTEANAGTVRIKRKLHDADWERALLHTQHTTEIGVLNNDFLLPDFLTNLPSTPVFPALRRIQIIMGALEIPNVELVKAFLPSHVSSIEMSIYMGWRPAEAVLNSIANDISLPELTTFSITTLAPGYGPAISQAILSHRSIQSLTIGLCSPTQAAPILQSAAQLPHLHHISISDRSRTTTDQGPNVRLLPRGSLVAVTTLKVVGGSAFVDAVLGLPVAGNMESIRIGFAEEDGTPFAHCLRSIGQFTHLKCLELQPEKRMPWSAVSMLVGCRELEVFRVVTPQYRPFDVSEADLERIADALPRLQELTLKSLSKPGWGTKYMPIRYLYRIATRFRTLRKLCVSVDATAKGNPTFDWTAAEAVANEALEELDVAFSKVDREAEAAANEEFEELDLASSEGGLGPKVIAKMFRAWWPRLRLVKGDDPESGLVCAEVNAIIRCESK